MLTLSFATFAAADNVLSQLPDAARRHGSGVALAPRLSEDMKQTVGYDLTVPDAFAAAAQAADPAVHAPRPPRAVSPLQMRKALRQAGLKAQADAYLETLGEEEREAWEYCVEVRRDNAFIAAAGAALEMSVAEIDALFIAAASL